MRVAVRQAMKRDGRAVRDGPHDRRGARARARAEHATLPPLVRHARRGGAHRRRRGALPRTRTPTRSTPIGAHGADRGDDVVARAVDLGQALGAASALRVSRSASACWPSSCRASRRSRAARASRHRPHDRRRGSGPARAVARSVRARAPRPGARRLGRARPRRAGVPEARAAPSSTWVVALARAPARAHPGAPGQGRVLGHARSSARRCRASPSYPVFTRKAHTDVSYLACARGAARGAATRVYPMFATHNAHTIAWVVGACARRGLDRDFEFQRLHGMGEALYDAGDRRRRAARVPRLRAGRHATRTCCPTSCAGCSRTAPTPRSSTASPIRRVAGRRRRRRSGRARARARTSRRAARLPLPRDLYGAERAQLAPASRSPTRTRWRRSTARSRAATAPAGAARADRSRAARRRAPRATSLDPADRARGDRHASSMPTSRPSTRALDALVDGAAGVGRAPAARCARWCSSARPTLLERERATLRRAARARGRQDACPTRSPRCARRSTSAATTRRGRARSSRAPLRAARADRRGEHARAARTRRVRVHLAVELPARDLHRPGRRRARRRQRGRREAGRADAAHRGARGRAAASRPACRPTCSRCCPATARPSARRWSPTRASPASRSPARPTSPRAIARALAARAADRAADRRDRRAERDDRRQLGAARAGRARRDRLGLRQRRASAARRCACCACRRTSRRACVELLDGAMDELVIGDPAALATDVGPVIDDEARDALERARRDDARRPGSCVTASRCRRRARTARSSRRRCSSSTGSTASTREVFGPVLHVVRFRAGELDALVDAINATGYGLTLGIHSRIDATIERIVARARVGNIYVNRNMIGAVVGVQPFGGEGLSGTGPKAGGPHYLLALRRRAHAVRQHRRGRRQRGAAGAGRGLGARSGAHRAWPARAAWPTTVAASPPRRRRRSISTPISRTPGSGAELRDAHLDPRRAELVEHEVGDAFGEALEQLVRMIRGERLDALDDRGVVERVGELAGANGRRRRQPESRSRRIVCGSSPLPLVDADARLDAQVVDEDRVHAATLTSAAAALYANRRSILTDRTRHARLRSLFVVAAYLIGSVSFAVVVSTRCSGCPIRTSYGSGNPGATNVLRTGNKAAALLTLAGDGAQGLRSRCSSRSSSRRARRRRVDGRRPSRSPCSSVTCSRSSTASPAARASRPRPASCSRSTGRSASRSTRRLARRWRSASRSARSRRSTTAALVPLGTFYVFGNVADRVGDGRRSRCCCSGGTGQHPAAARGQRAHDRALRSARGAASSLRRPAATPDPSAAAP